MATVSDALALLRQEDLTAGFSAALRAAHRLTPATAVAARPLLHAAIQCRLPAHCLPQCCDASWVRWDVLRGRRALLMVWAAVDPAVASTLTPSMLDTLLNPRSKGIAIATAQLFCRAPQAAAHRVDLLVRKATDHPRWQVRRALSFAVRQAWRAGARPPELSHLIRALEADGPAESLAEALRLEALRASAGHAPHADSAAASS